MQCKKLEKDIKTNEPQFGQEVPAQINNINKMKTLTVTLLALFFATASLQAQMNPLSDMNEFSQRLTTEATALQSIESSFTQEKYLDVFDEKIVSQGQFYYKKENKICMQYNSPLDYLIVINGTKLKIVSDGKKSIMNLGANKMMSQVQDMLTACMVGDLSKLSGHYELSYFEDKQYYLVKIKPISKAMQAYVAAIDIYLDKKDMSVHRLRLSETATNYTEYTFRNKKFNALTDEKIFAVQ